MELHQLRYFVAAATSGTFTRAADRCGVTQPTLSEQIQKLEANVGRQLFDRLGRRVVLTAAGEQFLPHAEGVLAAVAAAERSVTDPQTETLRVGAIPTIAPFLLPAACRQFAETHPKVKLILREERTEHVVAAVAAGELDVGLMVLPVPDERLTAEALFVDPFRVVLPADHPLGEKTAVRLADLAAEPVLLLDAVHCFGEQVFSLCRRGGLEPNVVCSGEQLSTLLGLVSAGVGVSVVPEMAAMADTATDRIYRPFAAPVPTRKVCAVRHAQRYRPPATDAFLDSVRLTRPGGRTAAET
jgi:LysR family transcriptional regulator, hydrogen peroxide-inducible genes activator